MLGISPLTPSVLGKLTVAQMVQRFPTFYETLRVIIVFASVYILPCPQPGESSPCPHSCILRFYFNIIVPSILNSPTSALQVFRIKSCIHYPFLPRVLHALSTWTVPLKLNTSRLLFIYTILSPPLNHQLCSFNLWNQSRCL
jgi:hypothetical protein